jgi:hypothetical protein
MRKRPPQDPTPSRHHETERIGDTTQRRRASRTEGEGSEKPDPENSGPPVLKPIWRGIFAAVVAILIYVTLNAPLSDTTRLQIVTVLGLVLVGLVAPSLLTQLLRFVNRIL